MYFSTRNVPALQGLSLRERQEAIVQALSQLSAGKKVLLNTIKLVLIAPLFYLLTLFDNWYVVPWLVLAALAYPLVITPVNLAFAVPLLERTEKKGS